MPAHLPAKVQPRFSTLSHLLRLGLLSLIGMLLMLATPAATLWSVAMDLPVMEQPEVAPTACFDSVWQAANGHPWYLDAEGQAVAPELVRDWLIVRFHDPTGEERPAQNFFHRYPEAFAELQENLDATGHIAAYRLRQGLPYGLLDALLQRWRDDPQVHSVQPAWRLGEQLYAPRDVVEIVWKTLADEETRQRLLAEAGTLQEAADKGPHTQAVTVDPCQRPAWQVAALLGEDLHVLRATPLMTPIEPPINVKFSLELPGAVAGTPLPFRLEIHFAAGIKIEAATIANLNLNPSGIFQNLYDIRFDQPLSAVDLSRSPIRITGSLRLYAAGDYLLPALPIYYTDQRSGESRPARIRSESLPVRIASMVPEGAGGYRLQVASPAALPTVADESRQRRLATAAILSGTGLLLLVLGAAGWRRAPWRRDAATPGTEQTRLQALRDELMGRLDKDPTVMQPDDWAALGEALQNLLGEYGEVPPTARGGSYRSFLPRLENRLSASQMNQAEALLQGFEHLLAVDRASPEARRALLLQARQLLAGLAIGTPARSTVEKGD